MISFVEIPQNAANYLAFERYSRTRSGSFFTSLLTSLSTSLHSHFIFSFIRSMNSFSEYPSIVKDALELQFDSPRLDLR